MRHHPAELVGQWIDSARSTPADTALWILGPSGADLSRHLRLRTGEAAGEAAGVSRFEEGPTRRYGYWYLQGELGDAASRALCFTNRPGRSAPNCVSFDLDSTGAATGVRRRLVVRGYQGEHRTGDRVLLWRAP
jgi:hypothetical protein